jgi:dolichyl-phosphate beta-glucosyltransferase
VVPCYNEEERLNLPAFREYCASSAGVDLLLVNDGSRDGTLRLLRQLAQEFPDRIQVLDLPTNRGKAEAVRAGFLHCFESRQYSLLGFWDADLATPLPTVARFVEHLRRHPEFEMVFGSRVQLCGRHIERQPARHYLGRVFATAVSLVLNIAIYDTQCGAKLFRATAPLRQAFVEPFLSRWIFDVEILARLIQKSSTETVALQIYEYPLERWTDVSGSKVKPSDFFRAIHEVWKIRRRYLR